ncbi:hypothetical protein Lal_00045977 [Lupinus albus]|uniref:Uncharacterized protein n=1 Tax=Lupinus albus TaxID=3870 RepID=A0A6A5NTM4_LUPAL|nr:hypothetical protein Lalb_Chr14g0373381 [Lupinus albus]KAF1886740.1 hypothetical protein Lal_00045977 [Lupinus albus]
MGCIQSKIENEEAVSRCKDRKLFIKDAVSARNAFAAAHSAYTTSLKSAGAALSDFAHGEVQHPHLTSSATFPGASQQPLEIPAPPPPLPNFPAPLQRAASMPEIKIKKPELKAKPVEIIIEEEDEEKEFENEGSLRRRTSKNSGGGNNRKVDEEKSDEVHVTVPQSQVQNSAWEYFFPSMENVAGTSLNESEEQQHLHMHTIHKEENEIENNIKKKKVFEEKPNRVDEEIEHLDNDDDDDDVVVSEPEVVEPAVEVEPVVVAAMPAAGKSVKVKQAAVSMEGQGSVKSRNVNLLQIFADLDDHFLKASESAHVVSKMLEATRLHYHSNYADNRGHIDHSARIMQVITWNRSFKGIPNLDHGKDDFELDEHETHATILDKLLAWEKKLYDEVKAGEVMKFEYQKKITILNKVKKRSTNTEALEKAKAVVSHLHTRYIVDMQSLDSTVAEINRLRDELLYPRLVQLVDGMATMWDTMLAHHEKQSNTVMLLKSLDISQCPKETSEHHHDRTYQLFIVGQQWHSQFEMLVNNQKGYVKALNNWLKINLIPIESSLKENVSSPPRVTSPPIKALLHAWQSGLDKLPDELARTAIVNFTAVIDTIFLQQEEEILLKRKCEDTRKEIARKTRNFEDWYHKYMQKKMPDEFDPDKPEGNAPDEIVTEKQFLIEQVKKRLENEEDAYVRQCLQVRQKSLVNLKNRMPELFRAMSDFSLQCSKMYSELRSISKNLNSGNSSL